MTLIYPPTQNGLQKTLGAQLDQGYTSSATFNNTTGVQNLKGLFIVDRIDSSGTEKDASVREYISFNGVSGSTVTTLVRGLGGTTDQDHAVGAVVEFVSDVVQQQAILDTITAEHSVAGVHAGATVTSLKATGANINTGTSDVTIVTPKAIADSNVVITDKSQTLTNKTTVQKVTAMAAQAIDGTAGNIFTRTLAGSETFTQSGFTAGQCFMVEVKQATGQTYTVTWFATVTWITSGGIAPTQTTTSNGYTTYGFRCTGTNLFEGYLVGSQ